MGLIALYILSNTESPDNISFMKKLNSGRGGKRPNSGAPKKEIKRERLCVSVSPDFKQELKETSEKHKISQGRILEKTCNLESLDND